MVQLKITPNLTCNGKPIDLKCGMWFEVAIDKGKEEGTTSIYKNESLAEALKEYHKVTNEFPKFIDAWAFPISDDAGVPYPIDQFSFEEM